MTAKLGGSLNDPKILSHMPTLGTPFIILPIFSLAASPSSSRSFYKVFLSQNFDRSSVSPTCS